MTASLGAVQGLEGYRGVTSSGANCPLEVCRDVVTANTTHRCKAVVLITAQPRGEMLACMKLQRQISLDSEDGEIEKNCKLFTRLHCV